MTAEVPRDEAVDYATLLKQGYRSLRFPRAVEGEFHDEFASAHRTRLRIGFGVAMALTTVYLLLRLRAETGPVADNLLALRGVAVGAMGLTLAISYLPRLAFLLTPVTLASYAIFALAATAIEVLSHRHGIDRHYEGLILVSFHVYVFSGLLFRRALLAGVFIFGAYLVGGAIGGLASKAWAYQLLFIALTHLIGCTALYSIERIERDNFLRRRLLLVAAAQDGLTGLYNRIAFFERLERTLRQAARERVAIGIVLLDVDHFKAYNDRYGHLEGDVCLRAVADAVSREFRRPMDAAGRYGGEEFVGVWYDIQPESLRSLAEQLRASVQALRIANRDAPTGRVTASVGAVACVPEEGEPLGPLVERADQALYTAKDKGRNRVVVDVLPSATNARRAGGGRREPRITA